MVKVLPTFLSGHHHRGTHDGCRLGSQNVRTEPYFRPTVTAEELALVRREPTLRSYDERRSYLNRQLIDRTPFSIGNNARPATAFDKIRQGRQLRNLDRPPSVTLFQGLQRDPAPMFDPTAADFASGLCSGGVDGHESLGPDFHGLLNYPVHRLIPDHRHSHRHTASLLRPRLAMYRQDFGLDPPSLDCNQARRCQRTVSISQYHLVTRSPAENGRHVMGLRRVEHHGSVRIRIQGAVGHQ
jgi:hypothetical protein